jgi:hypothetical protein
MLRGLLWLKRRRYAPLGHSLKALTDILHASRQTIGSKAFGFSVEAVS